MLKNYIFHLKSQIVCHAKIQEEKNIIFDADGIDRHVNKKNVF